MAEKRVETDDQVKLKPLMGIRPGVYLTVLYSVVIMLFLFWLLFYHGIKNHGGVLLITSDPEGAAVRINGVYMGTTGDKILVPAYINQKESVKIDVVLPGFESEGGTYQIQGRVFGTRFFPRPFKLKFSLKTGDPSAAFAEAASEYAAWTFGGEPTERWQVPLVLSEAAYRVGPASFAQDLLKHRRTPHEKDILAAASRFASTRAALRDLIRAKMLLDNGGNAPSPASLASSTQDILVFLSENEGSASWLAGLLPAEYAAVVVKSNWYKNELENTDTSSVASPPARTIALSGLTFTGNGRLMIGDTSVSKSAFARFLNENPESKEYYTGYFDEITAANTVTGVTWDGANAFCKWLEKQLPSSMADMEVRLPTESEILSLSHINRDYFEWTNDPFAPNPFIKADKRAVKAVGSSEITIIDKNGERASLPPYFSSPFVTFRAVIAVKE